MSLSAEQFTIRLPRPFRIAHGSSNSRDTILVHLHDEESGLTGHGEGALPPYYPSKAVACLEWLEQLQTRSTPAPEEAAAAQVALEIAQHDARAQRLEKPLWELLTPSEDGRFRAPPVARTLSIPENGEELISGLRDGEARGSTYFKLKLGSGDTAWDAECVAIARRTLPMAKFSVDVNGGWSPQEAARIIPGLGVDFIEQPVAKEWEAWRELRIELESLPCPPLVADESVQHIGDLALAASLADGVNVKLLKAGGITGAMRWIEESRKAGLKVMIGVMVETGIGRTAAAHLAPLADWLDIDPPDSIPTEPLTGFTIEGDTLLLSRRPGLGLR